jgi:hypothetical protein
MSIWTHVNGSIRLDDIRCNTGGQAPDVGVGVGWDDEDDAWERCDRPTGSEGSVNVEVWTNPMDNCMAAYTVTVHGDLRDYDDVDAIVAYFTRITTNRRFGVRSGVFEINVGDGRNIVGLYKNDAWVIINTEN